MTKVSKKDILLLIAVLGILAAVCSYFLLYLPLGEKATAFEAENIQLQTRVDELQKLKNNEAMYLEDTEKYKAEKAEILDRFPADVRAEDMIMLATEMGYAAPVIVVNTTMEDSEDLYHIGARVEEAKAAEAAAQATAQTDASGETDTAATDTAATDTTSIKLASAEEAEQILYGRKFIINFRGTYDAVKNCIKYIYDNTDRKVVGAMNATYEEDTGLITVSLGTVMYYITGTGKEYVEPSIPFIPQGTDDPFGAIEILPDVEGIVEDLHEQQGRE